MVYLYYYDGKLKDAPHKYPESTGLVRELNKWTHKIDAGNGVTNNRKRLSKLYRTNEDVNFDYHVLTNNIDLVQFATHLFVYNSEKKTWVLKENPNQL